MLASHLIKKLKYLMSEYGDLEVQMVTSSDEELCVDDVEYAEETDDCYKLVSEDL